MTGYVQSLSESEHKSEYMFITRTGKQITYSFPTEYLDNIKEGYYSHNKSEINLDNPFTPTGFAKYAVINMILNGVNQSVISDLTGFMTGMYSDCQDIVNEMKLTNRNRYINHMIRGISTHDEI